MYMKFSACRQRSVCLRTYSVAMPSAAILIEFYHYLLYGLWNTWLRPSFESYLGRDCNIGFKWLHLLKLQIGGLI